MRSHRPRRLALAAALLVTASAAAGPVWAGVGAPRVRAAAQVAGYGLRAQSAAVRYQLNSPGLLPVGDAAEGTVFEVDVPFSRSIVTQGPVINVVSSPAYPGDTASHLGTAFATFDPRAAGFPNYPIVAEANYPPSPGFGQDAAFGSETGSGLGVGTGTSHAGPDGSSGDARVAFVAVPPEGAAAVAVGASTATNDVRLKEDAVLAEAVSRTGSVTIADIITIADITATASATSDGVKATPTAQLHIGKVSVAGQPAYIDGDGIHLVGQQPVGSGVAPGVESLLQRTLAQDGISIRAVSPHTTTEGGAATADAGGIVVTLRRVVPALGIPGLPALAVPGGPIVPLGTPELPLVIEIVLGHARVSTNATGIPTDALPDVAPPGTDVLGTGVASEVAPTGAGASAAAALNPLPAVEVGGGGGLEPAVASGPTGPLGSPIPIPWVIAGVAVSIMLCGPLLGYARWQLLEGRAR